MCECRLVTAKNKPIFNQLFFIACMILRILLSSLAFCKLTTAHTAAMGHPIRVHCKIRHRIPVRMRPLSIKDNQGISMAMSVIW